MIHFISFVVLFLVFTYTATAAFRSPVKLDYSDYNRIFKITNDDEAFNRINKIISFSSPMILKSPSTIEQFEKLKSGVIEAVAKLENYKTIDFKLQTNENVRYTVSNTPFEFIVARMIGFHNTIGFVKYYLNSTVSVHIGQNRSLFIYGMEKIKNPINLLDWSKKNKGSDSKEKNVRKFFKVIFGCLDFLMKLGYLHKDLKPENILISEDDKVYLTGLESVVLAKNYQSHLQDVPSEGYRPFSRIYVLPNDEKFEVDVNPDRIHTFSFCMSLYVVMCNLEKPPARPDSKTPAYDHYGGKCPNFHKISADLRFLFELCFTGLKELNSSTSSTLKYDHFNFNDLATFNRTVGTVSLMRHINSTNPTQLAPKETTNSISLDTIKKVFKFYDEKAVAAIRQVISFDEPAIMLYPASIEIFKSLSRCNFEAFAKKENKKLVFKMEVSNLVRKWWPHDLQPELVGVYKLTPEPAEMYVSKLVKNTPGFVKYYQHSTVAVPIGNNRILYIYGMDKIKNAENLLDWSWKRKGWKDKENLIKTFFKTIFGCLKVLMGKRLVYTDLKPENILIGENQAYLIDLESVVNPNSTNFLYTPTYVPFNVIYELSNKVFRIENTPNRVLIFTYCMSIYVVVCNLYEPPREPSVKNMEGIRQHYQRNCPTYDKISSKLKHLLESCLLGLKEANSYNNALSYEYFQFSDLDHYSYSWINGN